MALAPAPRSGREAYDIGPAVVLARGSERAVDRDRRRSLSPIAPGSSEKGDVRPPSRRDDFAIDRGSTGPHARRMGASMRRTVTVAVLAACGLVASRARADARPIALRYAAPAECPDERAFRAQVAARTPLARFDDAATPAYTVTITAARKGYAGRIESSEGAAETHMSASCPELVGALSLVLALAIDPDARTAPIAPPPSPPQPPPGPSPAPPPPAPPSAPERDATPSFAPPARWRASLGLDGALRSDVAPSAAPAFGAFVAVGLARSGWAPSLRVGASYAWAGFDVPDGGGALTTRLAAHADACVWRLGLGELASIAPCAAFELASLHAEGRDLPVLRAATALVSEVGGLARLTVEAPAALFVAVDAGAFAPLARPSFTVDRSVAYTVPSAVAEIALAAGFHFL